MPGMLQNCFKSRGIRPWSVVSYSPYLRKYCLLIFFDDLPLRDSSSDRSLLLHQTYFLVLPIWPYYVYQVNLLTVHELLIPVSCLYTHPLFAKSYSSNSDFLQEVFRDCPQELLSSPLPLYVLYILSACKLMDYCGSIHNKYVDLYM